MNATFKVSETIVAHPTKDRFFVFDFRTDYVVYTKTDESGKSHAERLTRIQALRRFKWLTETLHYHKIHSDSYTVSISE